MDNRSQIVTYVAERIINSTGSGEGSLLPPRQVGAGRVPIVTGLQVTIVQNYLGGTQFTLIWNNPPDPLNSISGYNVYYQLPGAGSAPILSGTVNGSPATVRVVSSQASLVTFYVQTLLISGNVSDLESSPSCTSTITAPVISASSITNVAATSIVPGAANQIIGTNPAATANEYKTLQGGSHSVTTTFATGSITLGLATQLVISALCTAAAHVSSLTYTAANTDCTLFADATSNNVAITAPPAPLGGQLLVVKRIDASGNSVTVSANTGQSIEAATIGANNSVIYQYDLTSTKWRIVAKF